jgi:hypothetical protein
MPPRTPLPLVLCAAAAAAVAVIALALLGGHSEGVSGWRLAVHVAAKWLLLGATTWAALVNARLMGTGTPIGRAWRLFGLGVGAFLAGELGEAVYQFGLGVLNPFPSLLDVFYVAGYPLLIAGLLGFVSAYAGAGYPMGSAGSKALVGGAFVVAGVAALWPLLAPVVGDPATPLLERLLSAAYPLLDIALLAAVALLLRGTWRFGGGRAWQVWALVLAGLTVMIAGDLRYAYFASGGAQAVDPASELLFVVSYLLLALGTLKQRELIQA